MYAEKKETISTRLSYFLSASRRINLHDAFPSESLFKPVKNSQTSLETPHEFFLVLEITRYLKKEYLANFWAKN